MKYISFAVFFFGLCLMLNVSKASAQCAPGVASAGNPSCIPQDRAESPIYQGPPPPGYENGVPPPAATPLPPKYGAFAVDRRDRVSFSYLASSERQAKQSALNACEKGGGADCRVISFKSICGALAQNKHGDIWLGVGRASQAINNAYQDCTVKDPKGQCHILSMSVCSIPQDDDRVQDEIAAKAAHATSSELAAVTMKLGEDRPWYGAFAYGPNEDTVHISMDDNDKDVAIQRALAQCKGTDCKVLDWINRQCGGIGLPVNPARKGQFIATTSDDPHEVVKQVNDQCRSNLGGQCRVIVRCTGEKYSFADNNPFPNGVPH